MKKIEIKEDFTLDKWCVVDHDTATGCVLMLAGRGQKQTSLPSLYWHYGLKDFKIVGLQTHACAWYPMPNGAGDQWRAIRGIPHAIDIIETAVARIESAWGIPKSKIVLLGFSAGGVMSLQVAAHSDEPYAGVVCNSGAILDPRRLPPCNHQTPILLTHSQDDEAFEWYERYLPMQDALIHQNYPVSSVESPTGGHCISDLEVAMTKLFIKRCLREQPELR